MKKVKTTKTLKLNKETVSKLSNNELNQINGGYISSLLFCRSSCSAKATQ